MERREGTFMRLAIIAIATMTMTTGCGGGSSSVAATPALIPASLLEPSVTPAGRELQPLACFDHPLTTGDQRFYNDLGGDFGPMGGGSTPHGVEVADGRAHLWARTTAAGTSWAGLWFSLVGISLDEWRLDLDRTLPVPIVASHQVAVRTVRLEAMGQGRVKIEVKAVAGADVPSAWHRYFRIDGGDSSDPVASYRVDLPGGLGEVKILTVVLERGEITIDRVMLETTPAAAENDLVRTTKLALAQLLRCHDATSGRVRDRSWWRTGERDLWAGGPLFALALAAADDLGLVDRDAARAMAVKALATAIATTRHASGLYPHWTAAGGVPAVAAEHATVDTALGLIAGLIASRAWDQADLIALYQSAIDDLDFDAFTSADGTTYTHGFSSTGAPLTEVWTGWGGESYALDLLRMIQEPDETLLRSGVDRTPPAWAGVGFITELLALFFEDFGIISGRQDRFGIDWRATRLTHATGQRAYTAGPLFGLSASEIINTVGDTAYLAAGIGDGINGPYDGLPGFGRIRISPHYAAMASSLDPAAGQVDLAALRAVGMIPPISGPVDSFKTGNDGLTAAEPNQVQIALNAAFTTIGAYNAEGVRAGRRNAIHAAAQADPRLAAAVEVFFPPAPPIADQ
jgi:hypothetical protein